MEAVRTVHLGLGPIGLGALRSVAGRSWSRVVGAVDKKDEFEGRDAGELAGIGHIGVPVRKSLSGVGSRSAADVVVHCTGSRIESEAERILEALDWGASVVSTCEELSYPWYHHPEVARRIDDAAKAAARTVIGTGINPGFAMDALAIALSGVAERVDRVDIHRVVDASGRRGPLQQKVGAGISPDAFAERRRAGSIGHVGLLESVAMVGAALGWTLDRIEETLDPVIAESPISTEFVSVQPGDVAGIRQVATGWSGDRELIRLHLDMFVGATEPRDTVSLDGVPTIRSVSTGLHGDICTAAIVANVVGAVPGLRAGLLTPLDLTLLHVAR